MCALLSAAQLDEPVRPTQPQAVVVKLASGNAGPRGQWSFQFGHPKKTVHKLLFSPKTINLSFDMARARTTSGEENLLLNDPALDVAVDTVKKRILT